jgi:ketosteroid isomerase-like protein
MNSAETLQRWLAAINGHEVTALAELMSPHFLFVDSLGNQVNGAKSMESGWRGYFAICPDYWIRLDHVMSERDTMLAAGEAGGTIDGQSSRTPAAWKAVIRDSTILEWQVFADNKPVYEILTRGKSALL